MCCVVCSEYCAVIIRDCAIAQTVSCCHLTMEAHVLYYVILSAICCAQSGTGSDFCLVLGFPCQHHSCSVAYSVTCHLLLIAVAVYIVIK